MFVAQDQSGAENLISGGIVTTCWERDVADGGGEGGDAVMASCDRIN